MSFRDSNERSTDKVHGYQKERCNVVDEIDMKWIQDIVQSSQIAKTGEGRNATSDNVSKTYLSDTYASATLMKSDNDQQFSNSNQTIGFPEFVNLLHARKVEELEDEILAGNVDPSSHLSNNTDRDNLMAVVGGPSAQSQEPMILVKKIDTEQISFIPT